MRTTVTAFRKFLIYEILLNDLILAELKHCFKNVHVCKLIKYFENLFLCFA